MVGIVKEDLEGEIAEFQAKAWPEAELFVDASKGMYRIASSGDFNKVSGAGLCGFICSAACCNKRRRQNSQEASKTYGGNLKGEGLILGSVLVVDRTGTITYSHAELAFDDHPDFSDVVRAALAAAARV